MEGGVDVEGEARAAAFLAARHGSESNVAVLLELVEGVVEIGV